MTFSNQNRSDILQDRFARKAASYLSVGVTDLPYDISERLRAARMRAVSQRKIQQTQTAGTVVNAGSSAALSWGGDDGLGFWGRVGAVLPLIALVAGLLMINSIQRDNRTQEIAEVDAALLIDDLPPAAFSDPGFLQFLKISTDFRN